MGGSTETTENTSQTQSTTPYWQAQRPMDTVLGKISGLASGPQLTGAQNNAFNNLVSLGQAGNPFAGGITNAANQMLSGGPDRSGIGLAGYNQYQNQMGATARGDYMDPNKNPFFGATTAGALENSMDELHKRYAAAGVSPTSAGSYGQRMGETVTDTLAPYFMQQYNQERQNQLGAQQGLYDASNATTGVLSNLDTSRFNNMGAGAQMASNATDARNWGDEQVIAADAQRLGLPLEQYRQMMGITMPAAQAFGTTTSTGTSTKSTETPLTQQLVGGAIGGIGLLGGTGAFGSSGWLPKMFA